MASRVFIASSALLALASAALAQPMLATDSYDVRHTFNVQPWGWFGSGQAVVTYFGFGHAWVRDSFDRDTDYFTRPQMPAFDEYGTDRLDNRGLAYNSGGVPCLYTIGSAPDWGMQGSQCAVAYSNASGSLAQACVEWDIQPFAAWTGVRGSFRSYGSTTASGFGPAWWARAYAFSTAGVHVAVPSFSGMGQVQWTTFFDVVGGSAGSRAMRRDPIVLKARDGVGGSAEAVLFDVTLETENAVRASWQNDQLHIDAPRAVFEVVIPPEAAMNAGSLRIEVDQGVVVDAQATGSFAGIPLPWVGAPTPIWMWLPTTTNIDFDASRILPGASEIDLRMDGGGDAPTGVGTEPSACRADLTTSAVPGSAGYGVPDGELNSEDFFYYLSQYGEGNVAVCDMTSSAVPGSPGYGVPDGLLNSEDFFFYLNLYGQGC